MTKFPRRTFRDISEKEQIEMFLRFADIQEKRKKKIKTPFDGCMKKFYEDCGVSQPSFSDNFIKFVKNGGKVVRAEKRRTTPNVDELIIELSTKYRARSIAAILARMGVEISERTVHLRIQEYGRTGGVVPCATDQPVGVISASMVIDDAQPVSNVENALLTGDLHVCEFAVNAQATPFMPESSLTPESTVLAFDAPHSGIPRAELGAPCTEDTSLAWAYSAFNFMSSVLKDDVTYVALLAELEKSTSQDDKFSKPTPTGSVKGK